MKRIDNNLFNKFMTIIFFLMFVISLFNVSMAITTSSIFKIVNVEVVESSETVSNEINSFTGGEIVSNTIFHNLNDYVLYKVTVKNDTSNNYVIKSVYDNNSNDYIDYIYDNLENKEVNANATFDIIIKALYKKEMIDLSNREQDTSVKFSINYLDKEEAEEIGDIVVPEEPTEKETTVNPSTGSNIRSSIIIMIISLLGLLMCLYTIIKDRKNKKENKSESEVTKTDNKKTSSKSTKSSSKKKTLILILGLLLIPFTVDATISSFEITLTTKVSFYDKYVVTYDLDGVGMSKVVDYGKKIEIDVPEKKGYTFNGWLLDNGEIYDANMPITEDINITASYTIIDYSIYYSLNNGVLDNTNPSTYTINDEIVLNNPSKRGYIFLGWKGTDIEDLSSNVVISKGSTGNRNYMASFDPIKYTITYNGITEQEKMDINNPSYYTVEEQVILKNIANRYDTDGDMTEEFVGWKEDNTISLNMTINLGTIGNKVYTAMWNSVNPNVYTITYELNGGSVIDNPVSFTKYTDSFHLNQPTKNGYEFIGWTGSNGDAPEKNITVQKGTRRNLSFEANYVPIEYSITYLLNGGSAVNQNTYTIEDEVIINSPTKTGYNFIGWSGTDLYALTNNLVIPEGTTGNKEYTANYEAINYNISYTLNGGTVYGNPNTYNIESEFTLNNPTKDGYHFIGWTGSNGNIPMDTVTVNAGTIDELNYIANFEANNYYVEFNKNDSLATGEMSNQEFTYDLAGSLNSNLFEKTNYVFDSWNTLPDGTGTKYLDEANIFNLKTEGTLTLYAQWKLDTYTIVFDKNASDATGTMDNQVIEKTVSTKLNKNTFTRSSYQFIKWNTQADGLGQDYLDEEEVLNLGNITLYAIWQYSPFNIVFIHEGSCTFNGPDGTITGDECQEYWNQKYVDSGVPLYNLENHDKDFEIGLTLDYYDASSEQDAQAVFINTKAEDGSNSVTGLVLRRYDGSDDELELSQTINGIRAFKTFKISNFHDIKIIRIDGVIYYSVNGGRINYLQDMNAFTDYYDVTTWFGGAPLNGEPYRFLNGQISNYYIKLGKVDIDKHTVTLVTNGGTFDYTEKQVPHNYPVGLLPTGTKEDLYFEGWYKEPGFVNKVDSSTLITSDITLYARFITATAKIDDTVYSKISTAISKAESGDVIKVIRNTDETFSVSGSKNVTIDLQGYTINSTKNNAIVTNNGKLVIKNGNIITSSQNNAAINNTGNIEIINVNITNTGKKQGVYNDGGTMKISDSEITTDSTIRAAVHNLSNGNLTITSGTFTSNYYSAVQNDSGEMVIGTDDNIINNSDITIQGAAFGVDSAVNYKLYDGTIRGVNGAVNDINKIIFSSGNTYSTGSINVGGTTYNSLQVVAN